jgi:hypothetical protein
MDQSSCSIPKESKSFRQGTVKSSKKAQLNLQIYSKQIAQTNIFQLCALEIEELIMLLFEQFGCSIFEEFIVHCLKI